DPEVAVARQCIERDIGAREPERRRAVIVIDASGRARLSDDHTFPSCARSVRTLHARPVATAHRVSPFFGRLTKVKSSARRRAENRLTLCARKRNIILPMARKHRAENWSQEQSLRAVAHACRRGWSPDTPKTIRTRA